VAAPAASPVAPSPVFPSKIKPALAAATPAPALPVPAKETSVKEAKVVTPTPSATPAQAKPQSAAKENAAAAKPSEAPHTAPVKVIAVNAMLRPLPKGDKLGSWHAQLGAAQNAAAIRANLKEILDHNPRARMLPSGVMVRNVEGRTFYRAWLGSYDSREEARSLCKALKTVPAAGCAIFRGATMEARND
jgi:hypothetical protein